MQMQEFQLLSFGSYLVQCAIIAVYSGIVEYRDIISNRAALCAIR